MKKPAGFARSEAYLRRKPVIIKEHLFKPNTQPPAGGGHEIGILINFKTRCYYTINPTGEAIWRAINGKRTGYAIASIVARNFSVSKKQALVDVAETMAVFERAGLIRWRSRHRI